MHKKLKPILLLSLISLFCFQKKGLATDVVVGTKTSSATGTVSISNSNIQQYILSTIPDLSNTTITSDQPTVSVSDVYNYLIFQVTNTAGDTLSIAVRLTLSSNEFSFQPHTSKDVRICKGYGTCTSCTFMFGEAKNIKGCFIRKLIKGQELNYAGCNSSVITAN